DREANLAACRGAVTATVRDCVKREAQRAAASKPAPAAPKMEPSATPKEVRTTPVGFLAPPRTIADITAILDKERPDSAKIAQLRAAAEAALPKSVSGGDLAQFYYDRGNARALLATNKEALDDGLKALEVGSGSEFGRIWRIRQFIGLQHWALADPKQALSAFQSLARDSDKPGSRGGVINASRLVAQALIGMGDISQ